MNTPRPFVARALFGGLLVCLVACSPLPVLSCGIVNHRNAKLTAVVRRVLGACTGVAPPDPMTMTKGDFGEPETIELNPETRREVGDQDSCGLVWLTLGADFDGIVVWEHRTTIEARARLMDKKLLRNSVVVEGTGDATRVTAGDHLDVFPPPADTAE